jgi:hypothetical protein
MAMTFFTPLLAHLNDGCIRRAPQKAPRFISCPSMLETLKIFDDSAEKSVIVLMAVAALRLPSRHPSQSQFLLCNADSPRAW